METVYLGAGCFWCVEAVFLKLNGVHVVESGYMGGHVKDPSYKDVCTGLTGHAEVIKIVFNPEVLKFTTLLEVFWVVHDPTTLNRQGADKGTQYRSAIFCTSESQLTEATQSKKDHEGSYSDPIVTEIVAASEYYPAEDYHQNFYALNPGQMYCEMTIPPKIKKLTEKFSDLLK